MEKKNQEGKPGFNLYTWVFKLYFATKEGSLGNVIHAADYSKLKCEVKTVGRKVQMWLGFPKSLHQIKKDTLNDIYTHALLIKEESLGLLVLQEM